MVPTAFRINLHVVTPADGTIEFHADESCNSVTMLHERLRSLLSHWLVALDPDISLNPRSERDNSSNVAQNSISPTGSFLDLHELNYIRDFLESLRGLPMSDDSERLWGRVDSLVREHISRPRRVVQYLPGNQRRDTLPRLRNALIDITGANRWRDESTFAPDSVRARVFTWLNRFEMDAGHMSVGLINDGLSIVNAILIAPRSVGSTIVEGTIEISPMQRRVLVAIREELVELSSNPVRMIDTYTARAGGDMGSDNGRSWRPPSQYATIWPCDRAVPIRGTRRWNFPPERCYSPGVKSTPGC